MLTLGSIVIDTGVNAFPARSRSRSPLATGQDRQITDHAAFEGNVVNTDPDTTMGLLGFNPVRDDVLLGRIVMSTLMTSGVGSAVGGGDGSIVG